PRTHRALHSFPTRRSSDLGHRSDRKRTGEGQALHGAEADPETGEGSGPHGHGERVDVAEVPPRVAEHAVDRHHQSLRMREADVRSEERRVGKECGWWWWLG